jgi:hypothetical protein
VGRQAALVVFMAAVSLCVEWDGEGKRNSGVRLVPAMWRRRTPASVATIPGKRGGRYSTGQPRRARRRIPLPCGARKGNAGAEP